MKISIVKWLSLIAALWLAAVSLPVTAASTLQQLSKTGTQLRLEGDFAAAERIQAELIEAADGPIGHIFAINTIVTQLTWDESNTSLDEALLYHANSVLAWCDTDSATGAMADYYCGQANFSLSFHYGLKGRYYQAGRHGTKSIELLESALAQKPDLIDAKMHLGVAYFVADNLPPYIRMFSRFLWFIPTGNSEKSLPYLLDVVENGDEYPDVARYIYSTLLIEHPELQLKAREQLQTLVDRYPDNPRFQLRLISLLAVTGENESTLHVARQYLARSPAAPYSDLAKIWMVRAHLGLNRPEQATKLFAELGPRFDQGADELPDWSIAWHMLTDGQLHDIANRREAARETYEEVIRFANKTYVSDIILDAAKAGLLNPYRPSL